MLMEVDQPPKAVAVVVLLVFHILTGMSLEKLLHMVAQELWKMVLLV